ncbi:MAG: EamA family transporter [Alphaproteobacteria bacterium]|nr:EamA family transporter [Alphaproteobacteria bacterium]
MSLTVVLAVLLAALLHASWNALIKGGSDRWLTSGMIGGFGGTGGLVVAAAFLPLPEPHHWPWLIGSGALHGAYFILLVNAYAHGDLGKVYPIARGSAPLIIAALSAPIVGDIPTMWEIVSILVIVAGVVALTLEPRQVASADTRTILLALATGTCIAAYSLFDAVGIRTIAPDVTNATLFYLCWIMVFAAIPIVGATWLARRGSILAHVRAHALEGIGGATIAMGSYGLILFAFANAPVASVAALRETGVVFAALIGVLVLGEKFGARRIPAAILVAAGAAALKFAA